MKQRSLDFIDKDKYYAFISRAIRAWNSFKKGPIHSRKFAQTNNFYLSCTIYQKIPEKYYSKYDKSFCAVHEWTRNVTFYCAAAVHEMSDSKLVYQDETKYTVLIIQVNKTSVE